GGAGGRGAVAGEAPLRATRGGRRAVGPHTLDRGLGHRGGGGGPLAAGHCSRRGPAGREGQGDGPPRAAGGPERRGCSRGGGRVSPETAPETAGGPAGSPGEPPVARISVLGTGVDPVSMAQALARAEALIGRGQPSMVVTINPELVMHAQRDTALARALDRADLVVP